MWSLYKDPDGKNVFEKESTVPRSSFINKHNGYIDKAILSETQEMKPVCYNNITIIMIISIF